MKMRRDRGEADAAGSATETHAAGTEADGDAPSTADPRRGWGRNDAGTQRSKRLTLLAIGLVALALRATLVLVVHPACPGDDERWATLKATELSGLIRDVGIAKPRGVDCFEITGDPLTTVAQARLISDGYGMSSPAVLAISGRFEPGAGRPPAWTFTIAALNVVGLKTPTDARLFASLLGALAVVVIGHLAWCLAGRRAGIAAAVIAACNPSLFINDFHLLNDGPFALVIACALLSVYRLWVRPSFGRAALLGALLALGYFTRAEFIQLMFLTTAAMAWFLHDVGRRRRAALCATTLAVGIGLIVPFWAWNVSRFHQPHTTVGSGITLLNASCDDSFYGPHMGMVTFSCFDQRSRPALIHVVATPGTDESDVDDAYGAIARDYIKANARRLPIVAVVRVLRTYGVYQPAENTNYDIVIERRGQWEPWLGLAMYYALIPFTVAGLVHLRRRRIPVSPFVAVFIVVTFTVATTFGMTRYRAGADVVMCIVGGIGVAALATWIGDVRRRRARHDDAPTLWLATLAAVGRNARAAARRVRSLDRRVLGATLAGAVLCAAVLAWSWTATPDPAHRPTDPLDLSGLEIPLDAAAPTKAPSRPECQVITNNRSLFIDLTQHFSNGTLERPGQLYVVLDRLRTTTTDASFAEDVRTLQDLVRIARDRKISVAAASASSGREQELKNQAALSALLLYVAEQCPMVK